jgi:hypothetical protein
MRNQAKRILEHRQEAEQYYLDEGLVTWIKSAKPDSKGKAVAAIKQRHHDRMVSKHADATSDDGTKRFYRHVRASARYSRLAAGKKPFQPEAYR